MSADRVPGPRRRGFTLLEVMVAIAISAVVLLGARTVTDTLVLHAELAREGTVTLDREANGRRLLRDLLLRSEVGVAPTATFGGGEVALHLDTWCETARGWAEPCRATMTLVPAAEPGGRSSLLAVLSTGERLELAAFVGPVRFDYLESAARGGNWARAWGPAATAPLAVRIAGASDTLILRTGAPR